MVRKCRAAYIDLVSVIAIIEYKNISREMQRKEFT
jgi:hypothetical protein